MGPYFVIRRRPQSSPKTGTGNILINENMTAVPNFYFDLFDIIFDAVGSHTGHHENLDKTEEYKQN